MSDRKKSDPRFGVKSGAEAFCRVCGWYGSTYYGRGAWSEAASELRLHKDGEAHRAKMIPRTP